MIDLSTKVSAGQTRPTNATFLSPSPTNDTCFWTASSCLVFCHGKNKARIFSLFLCSFHLHFTIDCLPLYAVEYIITVLEWKKRGDGRDEGVQTGLGVVNGYIRVNVKIVKNSRTSSRPQRICEVSGDSSCSSFFPFQLYFFCHFFLALPLSGVCQLVHFQHRIKMLLIEVSLALPSGLLAFHSFCYFVSLIDGVASSYRVGKKGGWGCRLCFPRRRAVCVSL